MREELTALRHLAHDSLNTVSKLHGNETLLVIFALTRVAHWNGYQNENADMLAAVSRTKGCLLFIINERLLVNYMPKPLRMLYMRLCRHMHRQHSFC